MSYRSILRSLLLAVVGITLFAGTASANQRFLPSGISSVSPTKAKSAVLDYALLNDEYAEELNKQAGVKSSNFNRKDWKQRGYSRAKANTFNTSLTSGGSIRQSNGAVGTKTLVLVHVKTGKKVEVMVRCANIRTSKKGVKCACKPIRVRKVNKIRINKRFSKTMEHVCPSGQKVTVVVNGAVKGWVKGRITAKVIGSAKIFLRQQVDLQVKAQISVRCADVPVVVPTPPGPSASNDCPQGQTRDSNNTCVAIVVQCKAGEVRDSAGNCVTQTNTAEQNCKAIGGTFNGATQLCTIIQINANCSNVTIVNGSGNVVSTSQEGNCNSNTPPTPEPKCPDGRPVPPEGCDRKPELKALEPAHVFVGGTTFAYARARDADGDAVNVEISIPLNPYAHASGETEQVSVYLSEDKLIPCPTGWTCFRKRVWGDAVGIAPLRATVTANGASGQPVEGSLKVEPDSGF